MKNISDYVIVSSDDMLPINELHYFNKDVEVIYSDLKLSKMIIKNEQKAPTLICGCFLLYLSTTLWDNTK